MEGINGSECRVEVKHEQKKSAPRALVSHDLTKYPVFPFHGFPWQLVLGFGPVDG